MTQEFGTLPMFGVLVKSIKLIYVKAFCKQIIFIILTTKSNQCEKC